MNNMDWPIYMNLEKEMLDLATLYSLGTISLMSFADYWPMFARTALRRIT